MSRVSIPWAPRVVLAGRTFRLPVQTEDRSVDLVAGEFRLAEARWSSRDSAMYYYLRAPERGGDCRVKAHCRGTWSESTIRVRTLDELRRPHEFNGVEWPRRWPVGKGWDSTKKKQTLQDTPEGGFGEEALRWWTSRTDAELWRQLPPTEIPKAHFVNAHQGCPKCGTAVFRHGGFYPWKRNHLPCDFRSACPSCQAVFPSNDLAGGDFTSGDHPDDGYGYFDEEGHIFLFAATYHRDQTRAFESGIRTLTARLRKGGFDPAIGRQLGLMLLRQAVEEVYLAAVPQFRYGPSKGVEEPWNWGQPDWAAESDPVKALLAKGTIHYSIDTPYVSETLALAYDTVWPLLRKDRELVDRARALGLGIDGPGEAVGLVEEMLASLMQCILDRGARSNLPRESQGVLALIRSLDRTDAHQVMDWLYDEGPDMMRTFAINDFAPDGTPPEATGGYNSIHTDGLFDLEYHLRQLRKRHPRAYPESRYPSMMTDPRVPRVARQPHEITMIGKTFFQFGDGSAPGTPASGRAISRGEGSIEMERDCLIDSISPQTVAWAAEFTGDPAVEEIHEAVREGRHRRIGTTVHDGVGIAILRTGEVPERAAAGIVYGDTTGHRHRDLLDVQLFAYGRPFLTDLGYPQSWATIGKWEGNWATHNTSWGILADVPSRGIAGRGRLVRSLLAEGIQLLDVEACRWAWDGKGRRWVRPGVAFRRLLGLVETDGEGVVLVDLSRVQGGVEHWRICRGLEGGLSADGVELVPRPGTVADPKGSRCATEGLSHPDYDGLACMDEVSSCVAPSGWRGRWTSRIERGVHLDVYQVGVSPSTELLTARATAVMGTPEESNYAYRAAIWRRAPSDGRDVSRVDLVFEPRVGEATLSEAMGVPVVEGDGSGVTLVTRGGRRISIYWSPESGPEGLTRFSDGTELRGSLAAVVDGRAMGAGCSGLVSGGREVRFEGSHQRGRIVGVDRPGCVVEVTGMSGIVSGDRVVANPEGRGHSYRVEGVEDLGDGRLRLKLDVTSLLGRAPVVAAGSDRVELGRHLMARTGNLHGTRLEADGAWDEIVEAANLPSSVGGPEATVLRLRGTGGGAERVKDLRPGTWVDVVDYVVGDLLVSEPIRKA